MTLSAAAGRARRVLWATALLPIPALLEGSVLPGIPTEALLWVPVFLWPTVLLLSGVLARSRLFFVSLLMALSWFLIMTTPLGVVTRGLPFPLLPGIPLLLLLIAIFGGRGLRTGAALTVWTGFVVLAALIILWERPDASEWALGAVTWLEEPILLYAGRALSPLTMGYLAVALALVILGLVRDRAAEGLPPAFLATVYFSAHPLPGLGAPLLWVVLPLLSAAAALMEAHALAYLDPLTGLPGRRAMEQYGQRLGRRSAVAMIDIDHFKKFNDSYGHHAGDQVLRMVASRLSAVRAGGKAFRYGGEEFTIIFRHNHGDRISEELEGLRRTIAGTSFTLRTPNRPADPAGKKRRGRGNGNRHVTVTISLGLAIRQAEDRNLEATRERADRALYQAKKQGRNCLVQARPV